MFTTHRTWCFLIVLWSFLSACATSSVQFADRVFVNGGVYTVDAERRWHEAVAVRDGAIIFVGSNDGASAYIGDNTHVTDLTGKMLLPGFHDAHAHVLDGGASLNTCSLEDSNDADKIVELLKACASENDYGADEWVVGSRWQLSAFGPEGPRRETLDDIFQGRPAVFVDSFGHNSWVSTRALEVAGIDEETADPEGGIIVREKGSLAATGTLRESAMDLVANTVPLPTEQQQQANLSSGLAEVARFGITAFIEPGMRERDLQPYIAADRNGTLSARVLASLSPTGASATAFDEEIFELLKKRESYNGKYLNTDSVKIFMDGVIETHTSHMLEPYSDDSGNFDTFYDQATANKYFQQLDAMGVQVHTHAIGDGSIRVALNAYDYAQQKNGANDNRHHMVHLQLVDETDIPRFAELKVAANFQALWAWADQYYELAIPLVGQQRADSFYPINSIANNGGVVVGGSDWTVSSLNPLDAIEAAVRRQDPWASVGPVHNEKERASLASMLDAYTRNAAWIMRLEDKTGSIEKGKRADLVVLDKNLFEISAEDINTAKVLMTLMDGKLVYSR